MLDTKAAIMDGGRKRLLCGRTILLFVIIGMGTIAIVNYYRAMCYIVICCIV